MITSETCIAIYNCHKEIEKTKNFISELETKTIKQIADDLPFYLKGNYSEQGFLTLCHTIGSSSKSLCCVAPELALRVAKEHLVKIQSQLEEFNKVAMLEAASQQTGIVTKE